MSDTISDPMVPTLPETLLAPLLDTAGDVLKDLEAPELPLALRPLAGFDRRGLARGAARQQLMRAIDTDVAFRDRAVERFLERPEVIAAVDSWDLAAAAERVAAAAEREDLPLLASALFAGRPPGWAFGLGVICGAHARSRRVQEEDDDIKALQTRLAAVDEARRRAEQGRALADEDVARLEHELREERRSRRAREHQAEREAGTARSEAEELERALAAVRATTEATEERARRANERSRSAETELRAVRAELAAAEDALRQANAALERAPAPGTGLRRADLQALTDAAELARRLANGLGGVAERARNMVPTAATRSASTLAPATQQTERGTRTRRAQVPVPAGLVAEDPAAVDAMLRTPQAVVLIDGYNVSMQAWPEVSPAEQRDRLVNALAELHLRVRCTITLVFDGAEVGPMRPVRRPGMRVVFSAPDEEADVVVVREVATLPPQVPALVVSSDGWVREHAEAEGARVIGAQALLRVLRG